MIGGGRVFELVLVLVMDFDFYCRIPQRNMDESKEEDMSRKEL